MQRPATWRSPTRSALYRTTGMAMVLSSFVAGCDRDDDLRPPAPEPCRDAPAGQRRGRKRRWTGERAFRPDRDAGLVQLVSRQVSRDHDRVVLAHLHVAGRRADDNARCDPRATPRRRSSSGLSCWTVRSPVAEGSLDIQQPSLARPRSLLSTRSRTGLSREVSVDAALEAHVPSVEHPDAVANPGAPAKLFILDSCFRNPRPTWPGGVEIEACCSARGVR